MANNFGIMLHEIGGGLADECGEELTALVKELHRRAEADGTAKGRFTLTLDFKVDRSKGDLHATVNPKIDVKRPPPERAKGRFYVDAEGGLSVKNPRQAELNFKAVDGGKGEMPRVVHTGNGNTKAIG